MFSVYFVNMFMTHHFNSLAEARVFAKKSGFECVVYDPDHNFLFTCRGY